MTHPLLRGLASPDAAERRRACLEAESDPSAVLLVPALAAALGDPVREVARAASQVLADLGRRHPVVTEALRDALRSDDPRRRIQAAFTLARLEPPGPRSLPALVAALDSEEGYVRWTATRILVEMGRGHGEVLPVLMGLAREGSPRVRRMALAGLRELAPGEPEIVRSPSSGRSGPMAGAGRLLWPLALVIATLAAYAQVRGHEFLSYDDPGYVLANPYLRLGVGWEGIRRAFSEPYLMNWIPLTSLSLQLDYLLHGLAPAGYLLGNLALHTLASLILYAALVRLTGAVGRSAFVAAVFALHPLHVESVAWISERKDVLSGLFFMLGLYAYAGYAERRGAARLACVTLCLLLGLLSKPSLVTFPFVLLLLDAWPLGRFAVPAAELRASLQRALLEKIPMLLMVAAFATLTFVIQRDSGAMSSLEAIPLGARLGNALESYVVYAVKSFWPSDLAVFYPHATGAARLWDGVAAGVFLLGVSALVARNAPARPYLAVGWLWYLGTLVPVIGLVQVGEQARADRYMYLPLIGLAIPVAWGAHELLGRLRALRYAAPAAGAALAALWVCTWLQVGHWRDTRALFEHALAATPENYLAHERLGDFHACEGDTDAGEHHYRQALAIRPGWATALFGLADVRARRGDLVGAIADYERELRSHPDHPRVVGRYGFALFRAGRFAEAVTQLELAVAEDPGKAPLHAALAVAYGQLGRIQEAIDANREALRLDPGQVESENNLAWLLATRAESTVQERAEAIRLAEHATGPDGKQEPSLLDTLAAAYAAGGRFEDAAATAARAAALAETNGEHEAARGIRERGELYRSRQAFVEIPARSASASP